jgi:hypothetical protein
MEKGGADVESIGEEAEAEAIAALSAIPDAEAVVPVKKAKKKIVWKKRYKKKPVSTATEAVVIATDTPEGALLLRSALRLQRAFRLRK